MFLLSCHISETSKTGIAHASPLAVFSMEGKVWTASNGRYLEVRAGAARSINAGGIKVWSYLVVTVSSFLVILPWICWT